MRSHPARGMSTPRDGRIGELRRRRPHAAPWLDVLGEALTAVADPAWARAVRVTPHATPDGSAPVLRDAALAVDVGILRRHAGRLLSRAMAMSGAPCSERAALADGDAVALLEAAITRDAGAVDEAAARAGLDREIGRTVVPLVALPVLHACRATWAPWVARHWAHPYCPVCGEWPTLTEIRGLEQRRRFRCFRCGGDWHADWVQCPYCGNRECTQLGTLALRQAPDTRRVETCQRCFGYVKTVATVRACPSAEIGLLDLDTAELDVAAVDHGYARSAGPGHPLDVTIVANGLHRFPPRSNGAREAGGAVRQSPASSA